MIKRIALMTALMAALVAPPVVAQPAKARATANVDLDARFKEAQTSPQLADDLYKVGRKVAAVCANCHGEGGTSTSPPFPTWPGRTPPICSSRCGSLPTAGAATSSWKA